MVFRNWLLESLPLGVGHDNSGKQKNMQRIRVFGAGGNGFSLGKRGWSKNFWRLFVAGRPELTFYHQ
jgi:hypothetical protein